MKKSKLINTKVILDNSVKFPRLVQFTNEEETRSLLSLLDEDILNAKSVQYLISSILYEALRNGQLAGSELINNKYFTAITEEDIANYPPNIVDGNVYNVIDKPIIIGNPYILLQFGLNKIIKTNYYISMNMVKTKLSSKEGNLLFYDEEGLYCATYWLNKQTK